VEIFIPLEDLIDIRKEIERLEKEKENLRKELDRVESKLNNEGFVAKAPAKVIEEEKAKKAMYQEMYGKVDERLKGLKK
jgi:valyl-tRNA synthetase